jgi:hypothetical protein
MLNDPPGDRQDKIPFGDRRDADQQSSAWDFFLRPGPLWTGGEP